MAGSKAADGVSATDMAKRLQLEQYKTQMLRNLNMFVSSNRLVVHNLPVGWDDAKLRQLLANHAGPKAVIREARIMRDMRNLDHKGVGTSKEFGFVTFSTHEHALAALRSLNNNPNIFSAAKRPIVAFSIENRTMVKAKEKRMQNSRVRNPTSKFFNANWKNEGDFKQNNENKLNFGRNGNQKKVGNQKNGGSKNNVGQQGYKKNDGKQNRNGNQRRDDNQRDGNQRGDGNQRNNANQRNRKRKGNNLPASDENSKIARVEPDFTGVSAKPGISKMRSRYNLKTQAAIHHQHLKEKKKKAKLGKKSLEKRKEDFIKQPRQKIAKGKKKEDDGFSKLVNMYKNKIMSAPAESKTKWYEQS